MTYSIKIVDNKGQLIGEMMTASKDDVMKFINKGFTVIDQTTGLELTPQTLTTTMGVSDGFINIG